MPMLDATRENLAAATPSAETNGHAPDDWDRLLGEGEIALVGVRHEEDDPDAAAEETREAAEEFLAGMGEPVPDQDDDAAVAAVADDDESTRWTVAGNLAHVDWRENVKAARLELKNAEDELLSLKEESKVAKKAVDVALDRLKRIIDRGPEQLPLFDREKAEEETEQPQEPGVQDESGVLFDAERESPAGEAWRAVTVEQLGLAQGLCDLLREGGLATLGEIADYTASGAPLTGLKGIGAGKAGKIEAACEAYWAANPRREASDEN